MIIIIILTGGIRWIIRIFRRSKIRFCLECRPRILRKPLWTPRISWWRQHSRILLRPITWRSPSKGHLLRWWWWWLRCWSYLRRRSWIPLTRVIWVRRIKRVLCTTKKNLWLKHVIHDVIVQNILFISDLNEFIYCSIKRKRTNFFCFNPYKNKKLSSLHLP